MMPYKSNGVKNRLYGFGCRLEQIFGVTGKKNKNHVTVIYYNDVRTPPPGDQFEVWRVW